MHKTTMPDTNYLIVKELREIKALLEVIANKPSYPPSYPPPYQPMNPHGPIWST